MILQIDMTGDEPIYQQIRNQIVFGVAEGNLKPGDPLPTVRQLASDLDVNPMTVNKAYALLREEGILEIDRRHGAKISTRAMKGDALDAGFDRRLVLLLSEARIKGVSLQQIKNHVVRRIEQIYGQEGIK